MKKLLIKTLGCKVNQCESEAIRNALLSSTDHAFTDAGDHADVVVVNTCTVTGKAAMQSRQAVRQAVRAHPDATIVVTGCHAQIAADELARIDGVDLVVGNRDKIALSQKLLEQLPGKQLAGADIVCPDIGGAGTFEPFDSIAQGTRTRPFLKIQDGCDAFCTYCIVPYARGRSRSLKVESVLEQVKKLGHQGYHEVVLTGIHIGCYGQDLTPRTDLYQLLGKIREKGDMERLRISSIEPGELSDDIIGLAEEEDAGAGRLCPHFHIPLQSGDDEILKRMHRPYTRDFFGDLVQSIHQRLPHAAIGVDTLIGFPGESDAAFENSYQLIRSLPVTYLHVFPFSARKGTPAYTFDNQVPPAVIKKRCERMRKLGAEKRRAFHKRQVGRRQRLLVEETRDRASGKLKGLTENYIPVLIDGPDGLYNTLQWVELTGITSEGAMNGAIAGG